METRDFVWPCRIRGYGGSPAKIEYDLVGYPRGGAAQREVPRSYNGRNWLVGRQSIRDVRSSATLSLAFRKFSEI